MVGGSSNCWSSTCQLGGYNFFLIKFKLVINFTSPCTLFVHRFSVSIVKIRNINLPSAPCRFIFEHSISRISYIMVLWNPVQVLNHVGVLELKCLDVCSSFLYQVKAHLHLCDQSDKLQRSHSSCHVNVPA